MQLMKEIPERFFGLFRSVNRDVYIQALLKINEEYEYNNYFLSFEVCVQVLSNFLSEQRILVMRDEQEDEIDLLEPPATRILRWLLKTGWLKKIEDFAEGVTNIVIPDYAAVFLDAFERLTREEQEETEVYIQNIYAILFSYKNDSRGDARLLQTALVNTRELNRVLQTMLHNMDKFFASLLEQEFYGDLLREHLDGYVEEIVRKKYHILKTTDNFYQYKTDIKRWLKEIAETENERLSLLEEEETGEEPDRRSQLRKRSQDILETVSAIERGIRDMERRIFYMDKEHTKYVRATVTRLNYLLNEERDMKGLVVQLLNAAADQEKGEQRLTRIGAQMNFSQVQILSGKSLYKRRKARTPFTEQLTPEEEPEELTRSDVLRLNRIQNRYSKKEIEEFLEERMENDCYQVDETTVDSEEAFEKLILAYDYALRKDSKFTAEQTQKEETLIEAGIYRYPELTFRRR